MNLLGLQFKTKSWLGRGGCAINIDLIKKEATNLSRVGIGDKGMNYGNIIHNQVQSTRPN